MLTRSENLLSECDGSSSGDRCKESVQNEIDEAKRLFDYGELKVVREGDCVKHGDEP